MDELDDLIDFNIKLNPIDKPPITETDMIYENDNNKLYQVIGINNSNKCYIKEVGHYSDEKKDYSITIHQMKLNDCDIKIQTPIYKNNEIDKMRLIIMEIIIMHENDIIGLNQFCFINNDKNQKSYINDINKEDNKINTGKFIIYDAIEQKIIKEYELYENHQYILTELIKSID